MIKVVEIKIMRYTDCSYSQIRCYFGGKTCKYMFIISNEKSNITMEELWSAPYEQRQKHHLIILKQNNIMIILFGERKFLKTIK